MAKIPRAIFYYDLCVKSQELKDKLKEIGMNNDRVEIIVMDLIDGEDLAKKLFKEVVKRSGRRDIEDIDSMNIDELLFFVSEILDYRAPKNKLDDYVVTKIFRENAKKLISFLGKQQDRIINADVLEKIKNTIKLLHDNNIYHRDLHERNIMISSGKDGVEDVYIIDFGSAIKSNGVDVYEEGNKRFVKDESVVVVYEDLTKSKEEKKQEKIDLLLKDLDRIKKRLKKKSAWDDFVSKIDSFSSADNALSAITVLATGITNESVNQDLFWNIKILAILELAKHKKEQAIEVVKRETKNSNPFIKNKMVSIMDAIK